MLSLRKKSKICSFLLNSLKNNSLAGRPRTRYARQRAMDEGPGQDRALRQGSEE